MTEISPVEYNPSEKYNIDSVISIKIIETIKFHLFCLEISSSHTGFASTAIIEQVSTNVFEVSSSISSGQKIINTTTIAITASKYIIWYGVKDFKKLKNLLWQAPFSLEFSIFSPNKQNYTLVLLKCQKTLHNFICVLIYSRRKI